MNIAFGGCIMDKQDLLVILDALESLERDNAWKLARDNGDKIVPDLQERLIAELAALPDADAERLAAMYRQRIAKSVRK